MTLEKEPYVGSTRPTMPMPAISKDEVADALTEAIRPYYKGFPTQPNDKPFFRRQLTGDETVELLTSIHNVIRAIRFEGEEV